MGEIALFLGALGVLLQVPGAVESLNAMLKKQPREISDEQWKMFCANFKSLKQLIKGGANLQVELSTWKVVHEEFTEYLKKQGGVAKLVIGIKPEDMQVGKIRTEWNSQETDEANYRLDQKMLHILKSAKEEIVDVSILVNLEEDTKRSYRVAVGSKNEAVRNYREFMENRVRFSKELKKQKPNRDDVSTFYQFYTRHARYILINANMVLVNLLSILGSRFKELEAGIHV